MPSTETPSSSELLVGLVARLERNPAFMANVLAIYRKQERISIVTLAQELETTPDTLTRLALCKRPDSNSFNFADQVRQLSKFTDIDAMQIANILRQVESLDAVKQPPQLVQLDDTGERIQQVGHGLLAAARDDDESVDEQQEDSSEE